MGSVLCCCKRKRKLKNDEEKHLALKRGDPNSVIPTIGFVLKTRRPDNTKIFINIFHHSNIKKTYPVPCNESKDKVGAACYAYGVIFATREYNKSEININSRNQMCLDAINLINKTFNEQLGMAYTTPRITRGYVGDARPRASDVPQEFLIMRKFVKPAPKPVTAESEKDTASLVNNDMMLGPIPLTSVDSQKSVELTLKTKPIPTIVTSTSEPQNQPISSIPELAVFWAKKRGDYNKTLYRRHFVVEKGVISFYNNELKEYPYGSNIKGKLILTGCRCRTSTNPGEELFVFIEPDSNFVTSGDDTAKDAISEPNDGYIGDRKETPKLKELPTLSQNESLKSVSTSIKGVPKNLVISFNSQADAHHFKDILQDHIAYIHQKQSIHSAPTESFKISSDRTIVGKAVAASNSERRNVGDEDTSAKDESKKGDIVGGLGLSRRDIDQETQAESLMPSTLSRETASVPLSVIVPRQPPTEVPELHKTWAKKRGDYERSLYTRYFVIDRGTLSYYIAPTDEYPFGKTLRGSYFLSGYKVRVSNNRKEQDLVFVEFDKDAKREASMPETQTAPTKSKNIVISFLERSAALRWKDIIQQHIDWADWHPEDAPATSGIEESKKSQWLPTLIYSPR